MRNSFIILLISLTIVLSACAQGNLEETSKPNANNPLIFVEGGTVSNTYSNYYRDAVMISDFYISQYEITQQEWIEVMGNNPSQFQGADLPVETVSWYDAIEYCNRRSLKEGLEPYYRIDKTNKDPMNISEFDALKWTVEINEGADGYRLPTEAEWEYAASGGQLSKNYMYSGSDQADEVAWYWRNAGDKYLEGDWAWFNIENNKNRTQSVGSKKENELGLHDMSGNVREWCWDWFEDEYFAAGTFRVVKGGGWIGDVVNTEISFRGKFEASGIGPDQGFRVARSG